MKLSTFIVGELKILRSRADWISVQSRDPILFSCQIFTKVILKKKQKQFAHKWLYPSYAQNRKFLNSDRGIALAVVAISRYICMFKIFTIPPALGTSLA